MTISKINLFIEQDWSPVIAKFEHLKNVLKNYPDEKAKKIEGFSGRRYDFGASGCFIFYDGLTTTKKTVGSIFGDLVENLLPWTTQLRKDMADLNLVGIGLQGNTAGIRNHCDFQESSDVQKHCKINYILGDYTDITYSKDLDGTISNYTSVKDTAWLMDTTKPHWVDHNTSPRYTFQLSFHQAYAEVADWFSQQGDLVYR